MTDLAPGIPVPASTIAVPLVPIPADQVLTGSPQAGSVDLDEGLGATVGVWEHTPGVSTDVESDEVFVVLAGAATLQFVEPDDLPSIELRPGVMVRLVDGMRTRWTVRSTLRKVYVS